MEKWKITIIVALLLSLVGFGAYQQSGEGKPSSVTSPTPGGTPGMAPEPNAVSKFYNGKTLPEWNFKEWTNTAQPIPSSALAGKTTLVEIFRTSCSHCQEAAPFMAAIDKRYGPRGLKMLGIQSPGQYKDPKNPENDWNDVQKWVKERKLKYPIAFDPQSGYFQGTVSKELLGNDPSNLFYPMIIVVGPDGKVQFSQSGHDVAKGIELGVQLEKRFPTSKDVAKNAADLMKWLVANLPELETDATLSKALTDDLAQRLK